MKLKINDKTEDVSEGVSLTDLIAQKGVESPEMVSIELNGEILERDGIESIILKENDEIEFLYFMGGGAIKSTTPPFASLRKGAPRRLK